MFLSLSQWHTFLHLECCNDLYFPELPAKFLFCYPVAGQRHHGWGRKNSFTKEAVAKIVDDIYRFNYIVLSNYLCSIVVQILEIKLLVLLFEVFMLSLAGKCKSNLLPI